MEKLVFRELYPSEIEVRVSTVSAKGLSLLLYKDARCDANILDETVGAMNWQRDHKVVKDTLLGCISIWDTVKKIWVSKWDAGAESFSEKKKGEASDSFKRSGFAWGVGRELYTSPFIWISDKEGTKGYITKNSKAKSGWTSYAKFQVSKIITEHKKIKFLEVQGSVNYQPMKQAFIWGGIRTATDTTCKEMRKVLTEKKISEKQICSKFKSETGIVSSVLEECTDYKLKQYIQKLK